jgi:hypothetical protein
LFLNKVDASDWEGLDGPPMSLFDADEGEEKKLISLPHSAWAKLTAIAKRETQARREKGRTGVVTRTAVVRRFVELMVAEYEKAHGPVESEGKPRKTRK